VSNKDHATNIPVDPSELQPPYSWAKDDRAKSEEKNWSNLDKVKEKNDSW